MWVTQSQGLLQSCSAWHGGADQDLWCGLQGRLNQRFTLRDGFPGCLAAAMWSEMACLGSETGLAFPTQAQTCVVWCCRCALWMGQNGG